MAELLARLKQRKLVQWALAYIAASFALVQVIDVVASRFDWPVQLERFIILALAVGFIVALVIAWYHGEKGRQRVSGAELLLIALVLVVGGGAVWYFGTAGSAVAAKQPAANAAAPPKTASAVMAAPVPFNPPADSIVVLPIANLSGDPKQRYFSDGITEELTGALGQNTGLTVIAWDTASRYAGSKQTPAEIGKALNVAHILDGSVQRGIHAMSRPWWSWELPTAARAMLRKRGLNSSEPLHWIRMMRTHSDGAYLTHRWPILAIRSTACPNPCPWT